MTTARTQPAGSLFDELKQPAPAPVRPGAPPVAPDGPIRPKTKKMRKAPENPERLVADGVLDQHNRYRASLLDWLRGHMRSLYAQRLQSQGRGLAFVTADDARRILDADERVPGPDRLNRNFLGALFVKGAGWEATGEYTHSQTPGSHGNRLCCWRFNAELIQPNKRTQSPRRDPSQETQ